MPAIPGGLVEKEDNVIALAKIAWHGETSDSVVNARGCGSCATFVIKS